MPEAAKDIHDSQTLESRVGALLEDMQAAPRGDVATRAHVNGAPERTVGQPASGFVPAAQDLATAVERLMAESRGRPPAAASPQATGIQSIDADLAGRADDVIAGEFADETEAVPPAVTALPAREAIGQSPAPAAEPALPRP